MSELTTVLDVIPYKIGKFYYLVPYLPYNIMFSENEKIIAKPYNLDEVPFKLMKIDQISSSGILAKIISSEPDNNSLVETQGSELKIICSTDPNCKGQYRLPSPLSKQAFKNKIRLHIANDTIIGMEQITNPSLF
jgi:hypothetical protein